MNANYITTISNRLNEALQLRNMSQVDLCKRSGLSKSSISSYLSGKYEPRGNRIFLLANALDVNPVWLSGFDVPLNSPKGEETVEYTCDIMLLSEQQLTTKDIFARQLRHYMTVKRMNTVDIAKFLNVSKQAVASWCNGEKMPRMDKIEKLSLLFNVKKSDLIEEKKIDSNTSSNMQSELVEDFLSLSEEDQKKAIEYVKLLKKASE